MELSNSSAHVMKSIVSIKKVIQDWRPNLVRKSLKMQQVRVNLTRIDMTYKSTIP